MDYPILFRNIPSTHSDLMHMDYFLPISLKRLFASHQSEGLILEAKDTHLLNALIIEQSNKMVVSPDYEFLVKSVAYCKVENPETLTSKIRLSLTTKWIDNQQVSCSIKT